jgi:hypothetical protein
MPSLSDQYLEILKRELRDNYVPHLPPLIAANGATPAQKAEKQVARALSAFVLSKHLDVAAPVAAAAVVDDFNDNGIDAIWYQNKNETLYLVQSKLRSGEQFGQDEALAFCAGARLLLTGAFASFNANVLARQAEIESALGACSHIRLVVAFAGSGISQHATQALEQLIGDPDLDEERLEGPHEVFDPEAIVSALLTQQAYLPVNAELRLTHHSRLEQPRPTYYGIVKVKDLVALHQTHGKALYERNIRYFLGSRSSDVNQSIQNTLTNDPQSFMFLNNGITALCNDIEPKGKDKAGEKKLKIRGLSIINGAQTVASAAELMQQTAPPDISNAKVLLTLIKADAQGNFGSRITRARNHQNPVSAANFASLDPEQERLRQELLYYEVNYHFRPEAVAVSNAQNVLLQEAIVALAWLQPDPRFAIWLKSNPASINDAESLSYKQLFTTQVSGLVVANAVTYVRIIQDLLHSAERSSHGMERLTYRHGVNAFGWVIAKRLRTHVEALSLVTPSAARQHISQAFDALRQQGADAFIATHLDKGPLAFFKSQSYTVPYLARLMETNYGLSQHLAMPALKVAQANEAFPRERLFKFMSQQAPQI